MPVGAPRNVPRSLPKVCRNDLPRGANAVRPGISSEDPVRLSIAAQLAFPDGSITASALRREAGRSRRSRRASGAIRLAGLSGTVTPHALRHTAATWLMHRGQRLREAAGFLGMSPEVLQQVYGDHHPDDLQSAAAQSSKTAGSFRWLNRWLTWVRPTTRRKSLRIHGRSGRIRTCDPCFPKAVLYRAEPHSD
jgi:hypothetical protein